MREEQRLECLRLYGLGFTVNMLAALYDRHRTVIDRLIGRRGQRRGHIFREKGVRYGGRQKKQPTACRTIRR